MTEELRARRALQLWQRRQNRRKRYAIWIQIESMQQLAAVWLASVN